jgi:hypothetical protein
MMVKLNKIFFFCCKDLPKPSKAQNIFNVFSSYEMYRKVPLLLLLLNASVKEDERGCQGHTSASLFHHSAT